MSAVIQNTQKVAPFHWKLDDSVKFSLQRCRTLSHLNVLAFRGDRRAELGLSARLCLFQRQQLSRWGAHEQRLWPGQSSVAYKCTWQKTVDY